MPKKVTKKTDTKVILPLKDMTVAELTAKSRQLFADISKKKLEKTVGRLKNTREIFSLRKELARVKTFISVKSRGQV
jgi:ribosomal protein L29